MTNEEITLEEYAECIQKCLENVLYDWQMAKDMKPEIVYATAPIAYAKAQERFANGENVGPLITFYQSGIEVDHSVQMGAWKYLGVMRDEGNYIFKAPIICDINYTVTISALTERQADMLQVQIMQATPFHRPYYTIYNGNYVCIENTEVSNLSSVDVGENKDKFSQRQLTLKIQRAYLHYDIKELYAGAIYPNKIKEGERIGKKDVDDVENKIDEIINSDGYVSNEQIKEINKQIEKINDVFKEDVSNEQIKEINKQIEKINDLSGNEQPIDKINEQPEVIQKLKNGAVVLDDNVTVKGGMEVKNSSAEGFAPYNYNVIDKNGNVIDVIQKGNVKVKIYSVEKTK